MTFVGRWPRFCPCQEVGIFIIDEKNNYTALLSFYIAPTFIGKRSVFCKSSAADGYDKLSIKYAVQPPYLRELRIRDKPQLPGCGFKYSLFQALRLWTAKNRDANERRKPGETLFHAYPLPEHSHFYLHAPSFASHYLNAWNRLFSNTVKTHGLRLPPEQYRVG